MENSLKNGGGTLMYLKNRFLYMGVGLLCLLSPSTSNTISNKKMALYSTSLCIVALYINSAYTLFQENDAIANIIDLSDELEKKRNNSALLRPLHELPFRYVTAKLLSWLLPSV
jgi:hypothetical protein